MIRQDDWRAKVRFALLACALWVLSAPVSALEIALISDLNGRYGSTEYNKRVRAAVEAIIERDVDLVISVGDKVAGQSKSLGQDDLEAMWAAFHEVVTNPLAEAGIPFAVTPGNHDGSALRGFEQEREEFRKQWLDRTGGLDFLPGSQWPDRWALRAGELLIVSFDGTRPGRLPTAEQAFIQAMLTQHRQPGQPILVLSHLPQWPLARGRERDVISDPGLLGTLQGSGVTVYASGHHHVYFAGTDDAGMMHLAVGALGGNTRAFTDGPGRQAFSFVLLRVAQGQVHVEALAGPDFTTVLPASAQPEEVQGPFGTLVRADQVSVSR